MALTLMAFFMLTSLRTDALHWRLLLAPGPGGRRWLGLRILQASAGFILIYLGVLTLVLAAVFGVMMEVFSAQVDWTSLARMAPNCPLYISDAADQKRRYIFGATCLSSTNNIV